MTRLAALTLMFVRPVLRAPLVTILVSTLPVSVILMYQLIGGDSLSRHALVGSLIVFSTNVGVVSLPQIAVNYKARGLQDMFVASPVGPMLYAAGMSLSRLVWVTPGLLVVIGILLASDSLQPRALPAIALVVLATWFTGTMIGFTIATLSANPFAVTGVANFLGIVLSMLPPVYYPLEFIPAGWRWIALLLPTTNAAQLLRISTGLADSGPPMLALHWVIVVGFAIVFGAITVRTANWSEP